MTDLATAEVNPYVPSGHPVRRFVAAVAIIAVLLLAMGFTGPFSARVEAFPREWTIEGNGATAFVDIFNHGRFPIEAREISGSALLETGWLATVVHQTEDDAQAGENNDALRKGDPIQKVRIQPGESAMVAVTIIPDCTQTPSDFAPPSDIDLVVNVSFGATRTVNIGDDFTGVLQTICYP